MKIVMWIVIVLLVFSGSFIARNTWGLRYLDDIRENAPQFLEDNGFTVMGCQGYETYLFQGTAKVWFTIKQQDIVYECSVMKRNGDYQLYNLEVTDIINEIRTGSL